MISLDREGNEVGGLKQRERPGALGGAGAFGPPAGGETLEGRNEAPRRVKTRPTARPWRGETPLRLPCRAPQPRRAAQKGSFPLLSPTECLFLPLKKKKKALTPLKSTPTARGV